IRVATKATLPSGASSKAATRRPRTRRNRSGHSSRSSERRPRSARRAVARGRGRLRRCVSAFLAGAFTPRSVVRIGARSAPRPTVIVALRISVGVIAGMDHGGRTPQGTVDRKPVRRIASGVEGTGGGVGTGVDGAGGGVGTGVDGAGGGTGAVVEGTRGGVGTGVDGAGGGTGAGAVVEGSRRTHDIARRRGHTARAFHDASVSTARARGGVRKRALPISILLRTGAFEVDVHVVG